MPGTYHVCHQPRRRRPGCQPHVPVTKRMHHVRTPARRPNARQPIRCRGPMTHPDLHLLFRQIRRQIGEHLPRKVAHDRGTLPVRRRVQSGKFHLTGQPQSLRRHHACHLPVTRHDWIARRNARVRDDCVIPSFRLQRHVIACLPRKQSRPRPRGNHRPIRGDLARRGAHGMQTSPSMRKPTALSRRSSAPSATACRTSAAT